ncbi:MAG: type II toxin-antitoxin system Phd/YefM family antitoxin [Deltaproteobacteria bacterium]|nr:type II toxin-antitoxin system Phd/YefM family antitoxin [Deltaproteobacteria bacterium]
MNKPYADLLSMEFLPLSEVKATLSEQVKKTRGRSLRVAITSNGRPAAVLMSYQDYLRLAEAAASPEVPSVRSIDFEDWKKGSRRRKEVSSAINRLFDVESLSRKGQKSYKKNKVDELTGTNKKRAG